MRKIFYIFIFFITTSVYVHAQDTWQNFKSVEYAFIAEFPKQPVKSVQAVPTAVGDIDMHMFMYQPTGNDDNAIYAVIRSDYPKEQFENADDAYNSNVLDGAVNGAVTNVNGQLLFEDKVIFNGFPSRKIKIDVEGAYIYMNAYLIDNILYITQVICVKENDQNKDIKRFMDSFDILKVKN